MPASVPDALGAVEPGVDEPGDEEEPGMEEEPGIEDEPGMEDEPGIDEEPGMEDEPGIDGIDDDPGAQGIWLGNGLLGAGQLSLGMLWDTGSWANAGARHPAATATVAKPANIFRN